jgi:hypothetical protein
METSNSTRVFVIGGLTGDPGEDAAKMRQAARLLGERLGSVPGHQLIVCSAHSSSADAHAIEGFAGTVQNQPDNVIVHRPLDFRTGLGPGESTRDQWEALITRVKLKPPRIRENSEARVNDAKGFANAFLLCQIRALKEDTDVVVALGGRRDASAAQLLAIARDTFPVVPFAFLGGAGEQEYIRRESALRATIKDQTLLDGLQTPSGIVRVLDLIRHVRRAHGRRHIFMSYSWERANDADYVEAFLRRDPRITLFRDEEDIRTGEPVSERIRKKLNECDIFLALWCAEYAASPNCFDEFRLASSRRDCRVYVLRLDDTRPVWPVLRKPGSHDWKNKWTPSAGREGVAASLSEMLNKL